MIVIISGTPGCGKTSVCEFLKEKVDAEFISINGLLEKYDLNLGIDTKRGYKIVDTEKMIPVVDDIVENTDKSLVIFEGHIAQDYPNADLVVVLRCNPEVLIERLNSRGWNEEKIYENVSAEILGICTSESYEVYEDAVQEIETDNHSIKEVAYAIMDIINDNKRYPLGSVDYLEEYFHLL